MPEGMRRYPFESVLFCESVQPRIELVGMAKPSVKSAEHEVVIHIFRAQPLSAIA